MYKQVIAVVEGAFNWLKHNNMFPSASPSFAHIFPCSEEWKLLGGTGAQTRHEDL
jgi:hypothetical protein